MLCDDFQLRRKKLMAQMDANSIAVFVAAKESARTGSTPYPYRQESDFFYLTGFDEMQSAIVLIPGREEGEFLIFCRTCDPKREVWHGKCIGLDRACSEFGANQAISIDEFATMMPQLLEGKQKVYFKIGCDSELDTQIFGWVRKLRAGVRDGVQVPHEFINVEHLLHEMRVVKSTAEIDIMRHAANITASAHLRAMHACLPGMYEYELEGELLCEFAQQGGRYQAFESIIGSGPNACTLHYCKNNERLIAGELVLVDAGVEYEYYTADVTRTFPVSGRFNQEQKDIYQAVLDAQLAVISMVKPGVAWNSLQEKAEEVITERLVMLGILKGQVEALLKSKAFKPFFMHKIGHFLGIDCHDVGAYKPQNAWRVLEPGMVFTVEPGIYIGNDLASVPSKWWNIGVRIEDNILVTATGFEVLTAAVPKAVHEIEAVMAKQF